MNVKRTPRLTNYAPTNVQLQKKNTRKLQYKSDTKFEKSNLEKSNVPSGHLNVATLGDWTLRDGSVSKY